MSEHTKHHEGQNALWRAFLTGDDSDIPEEMHKQVFLEKAAQRIFGLLPSGPRCIDCNAPFHGVGGAMVRLIGFTESDLTPKICNHCDKWIKRHEAGAEVELTMLFADVRGSTSLAETMQPYEFRELINRFYKASTDALVHSDALIEKLIGDEVASFFVPGIAGPDYARRAVEASQALLLGTGHDDKDGPWVPVGVGIHSGVAYVGVVGTKEGMSTITVLGDVANTASRLASEAGPGEVVISEETFDLAEMEATGLEQRQLDLKGKQEAVEVRVMRVGAEKVTY